MKLTREELVELWEMGKPAAAVTLPSDKHCALVEQCIEMMDVMSGKGINCPECNAEIYFVMDSHINLAQEKADANKYINKLREALRFYADKKNYEMGHLKDQDEFKVFGFKIIHEDKGEIARKALGIEE